MIKNRIIEFAKDSSCLLCLTPDHNGAIYSPIYSIADSSIYGTLYDPTIETALSANIRNIYSDKNDKLYLVDSISNFSAHNFKNCIISNCSEKTIEYYLDENDITKIGTIVNNIGQIIDDNPRYFRYQNNDANNAYAWRSWKGDFVYTTNENVSINDVTYSDNLLTIESSTISAIRKYITGDPSMLTGEDGDVMSEWSIVYYRIETMSDGRVLYLVSSHEFENAKIHPCFYISSNSTWTGTGSPYDVTFTSEPHKQYIGVYKSVLCDSNGIPLILNENDSSSGTYQTGYVARSIAEAKPWTKTTQETHRIASANNGAVGINSLHKQFLAMMMLIDGNSFDTQTTISLGFSFSNRFDYRYIRLNGRSNFGNGTGNTFYNESKDEIIDFSYVFINAKAYHRDYINDSNNYFAWNSFESTPEIYYTVSATPAISDIVYSDDVGTDSGYTITNYSCVTDIQKIIGFSYRGIENPYSAIWEFEDGIQKYQNIVESSLVDGCYWWTANTSLYTDIQQQLEETPTYIKSTHIWPDSGLIKTCDIYSFFPISVGGTSTTYLCDNFTNNINSAGTCFIIRGGEMNDKNFAGIYSIYVNLGLMFSNISIGGRISC